MRIGSITGCRGRGCFRRVAADANDLAGRASDGLGEAGPLPIAEDPVNRGAADAARG